MKRPSWWVSLIPFIVLVAVLVLVIKAFGADALEGGSQVALMFAAGVTVAISMVFYRIKWRTLEDAMVDNLKSVGTSVIILLLIGAVAGSWMISGVAMKKTTATSNSQKNAKHMAKRRQPKIRL